MDFAFFVDNWLTLLTLFVGRGLSRFPKTSAICGAFKFSQFLRKHVGVQPRSIIIESLLLYLLFSDFIERLAQQLRRIVLLHFG